MKLLAAFLLFGHIMLAQTHMVFVQSNEAFAITNSTNPKRVTAAWLAIPAKNCPVQFSLSNGKQLVRTFPNHVENGSYKIVYNKIRFRPNQTISTADTLYIDANKMVVQIDPIPETQISASILSTLKDIPYEWEKSEYIIAACQKEMPTCELFLTYLGTLKFAPSKVDVLNALESKLEDDCFEKAKQSLPEHAQQLLRKP